MDLHSWTPRGQCPQQLTALHNHQSGTIWNCCLIIYKPSPVSYPMMPCAVTVLVWSWDNVRTATETSGSASSFTRVQLSDGLLHMLRAPLSSVQVWFSKRRWENTAFLKIQHGTRSLCVFIFIWPTFWNDLSLIATPIFGWLCNVLAKIHMVSPE